MIHLHKDSKKNIKGLLWLHTCQVNISCNFQKKNSKYLHSFDVIDSHDFLIVTQRRIKALQSFDDEEMGKSIFFLIFLTRKSATTRFM